MPGKFQDNISSMVCTGNTSCASVAFLPSSTPGIAKIWCNGFGCCKNIGSYNLGIYLLIFVAFPITCVYCYSSLICTHSQKKSETYFSHFFCDIFLIFFFEKIATVSLAERLYLSMLMDSVSMFGALNITVYNIALHPQGSTYSDERNGNSDDRNGEFQSIID